MYNPKFSFDPTLKLDYSSDDKLYNSLKAKKITKNNIQLIYNEIRQHTQSEPFVIEVLVKFLFEKIVTLEENISNLKKALEAIKNDEYNERYLRKEIVLSPCCEPKTQEQFVAFQEATISNEKIDVKWIDSKTLKVNKANLKEFNELWKEYAFHECFLFGTSSEDAVYRDRYYFYFK